MFELKLKQMVNRKISWAAVVFIILCIAFVAFSFSIYLKPLYISKYESAHSRDANEGRLIWQKYNCQSCHQLYGLGGYLGPDLTNVYRKFNGNADVLKFFFKGGMKQMPKFSMDKQEEELLIQFLKSTDASGNADPRNYKRLSDGMIQQNGK